MEQPLIDKLALFRAASQTNKQIFITLIAPFSIIPNPQSIGLIDNALGMDVFFLNRFYRLLCKNSPASFPISASSGKKCSRSLAAPRLPFAT